METFRVAPMAMTERLDPGHYRPVLVENDALLRRFGARDLAELYLRSGIGHTAAVTPHYTSTDDGVAYVSGGCIVDGHLELAGAAKIRRSAHVGVMGGSRLEPGWVLLVRKGELGNSAVVPAGDEVNCSSEVMFLQMRPEVDSGFVSSYFNSRQGRMAFLRQQRGMMITSISLYDVPGLPVPRVQADAAYYIGDKVRQAERLRERARRIEASVATTHAQYLVPPTGIDFAKRTRRLAARSLTERLDAHFYPSAVEQYFRQLAGPTRTLDRLCTLVINGQSQPEAEDGVRQATVANLGRTFVEGALRIVERPADGARAVAPHDLLLCNAAHNKSYIGRDVTYSQVEGPYPSTEVMVVRVDRTQLPASFVREYLKTEIGYLQIQSTIRGITAHSYPTDVKLIEIPFPAVPDVDRDAWFATDDQMLAAGRCFDAAKFLTVVATSLVEQLIDGSITEADLVAAQKAVRAGDRSADREILKALRQSNTPEAKHLIVDADELYALLDESDGQDA